MGQYQSSGQIKFPYKKDKEIWSQESNDGYKIKLFDGNDTSNNKPVSIFSLYPISSNLASNFYRRIKTFKHPNLLNYINGTMVESENSYYIVTERVRPLNHVLKDLLQYDDSISWGIYQISRAVAFFNKQNLVHGNINIENIFINEQSDWQLGGFQLLSNIEDVKSKKSNINNNSFRSSAYNIQWPPEIVKNALDDIQPYSIDSWLIGCFIYSLFNYEDIVKNNFEKSHLKNTQNIPSSLKDEYIKLLSVSPRTRLSCERLIDSPYFQNEFVRTCIFLETISIKDASEKENFCKTLFKIVDDMPDMFRNKKLLPTLVSSLDYGLIGSYSISTIIKLLKMAKDYSSNQLTASIAKWFSFNDRGFRIALLENIETLIDFLDTNIVSDSIWNPLTAGFTDIHPYLRELTVKSLVTFAPKLKSKILNNDALKFLAKLQSDKEPGIRTNTTICIGKLANYLNESTRKKVLIPAFRTALKDPFPPCRKAGLNSFSNSHNLRHFTAAEIAHAIIPLISPLTVDPDDTVREIALSNLNTFLLFLNEHSKSIPRTENNSKKAELESQKGVFSWAISSLATKIIGYEETQNNNITEDHNINRIHETPKIQIKEESVVPTTKEKKGYQIKSQKSFNEQVLNEVDILNETKVDTNGWDEGDIFDNEDFTQVENEQPQEKTTSNKDWSSRWDDDDDFDFDEPISNIVRRHEKKL